MVSYSNEIFNVIIFYFNSFFSFNPARDFGPRIIALWAGWGSVAMKGWWVYVAAPLVGAPVGAWIADKILYPNK